VNRFVKLELTLTRQVVCACYVTILVRLVLLERLIAVFNAQKVILKEVHYVRQNVQVMNSSLITRVLHVTPSAQHATELMIMNVILALKTQLMV
jgi:hypothetical protein